MSATGDEDVAKLQKKIAKLEASGADAEKLKKLQKKLKKAGGSDSAAPVTEKAPKRAADKVAEEAGASGKKSKKAKKAAAAAAEEEVLEAAPAKKEKKAKAAAEAEPVVNASVGDAELARNGKPVVKRLYKEHPEVTALSAATIEALYQERYIAVEGSDIKPVTKFEHTGLPKEMLQCCRAFKEPSPIQSQCWPIIMSGHDLIGIAATGSGKTLAFGLPALRHIQAQRDAGVVSGKGPFALAMAPTRELAMQIAAVITEAGKECKVRCVCVYGGVPKRDQQIALREGVEFVVGTPGRLEDLMNEGSCRLNQVTYLVLDEADRMLDLGFEPHIRAICSTVRTDRQTLMFSATWPSAVQKLAANFMASAAIKVNVGSQDLAASHSIAQTVEVIDPFARNERLLQLLNEHHKSRKNRIIIFVLYKKEAPQVEQLLSRKGWTCGSIHGDISQNQRTAAVEAFKAGTIPLLIATDVAARGLDIPDVEVVINYSFPLTTEDYVHRIGRTGRAGKTGIAHTFFCAGQDKPRAGELINVLREAGQDVPKELLAFGTTVKKKESGMYGAHFKDIDFKAKATKLSPIDHSAILYCLNPKAWWFASPGLDPERMRVSLAALLTGPYALLSGRFASDDGPGGVRGRQERLAYHISLSNRGVYFEEVSDPHATMTRDYPLGAMGRTGFAHFGKIPRLPKHFAVKLTRLGCGGSIIAVTLHHAVLDGHSASLLLSDWAAAYRATAPLAPPLPIDSPVLLPLHRMDGVQGSGEVGATLSAAAAAAAVLNSHSRLPKLSGLSRVSLNTHATAAGATANNAARAAPDASRATVDNTARAAAPDATRAATPDATRAVADNTARAEATDARTTIGDAPATPDAVLSGGRRAVDAPLKGAIDTASGPHAASGGGGGSADGGGGGGSSAHGGGGGGGSGGPSRRLTATPSHTFQTGAVVAAGGGGGQSLSGLPVRGDRQATYTAAAGGAAGAAVGGSDGGGGPGRRLSDTIGRSDQMAPAMDAAEGVEEEAEEQEEKSGGGGGMLGRSGQMALVREEAAEGAEEKQEEKGGGGGGLLGRSGQLALVREEEAVEGAEGEDEEKGGGGAVPASSNHLALLLQECGAEGEVKDSGSAGADAGAAPGASAPTGTVCDLTADGSGAGGTVQPAAVVPVVPAPDDWGSAEDAAEGEEETGGCGAPCAVFNITVESGAAHHPSVVMPAMPTLGDWGVAPQAEGSGVAVGAQQQRRVARGGGIGGGGSGGAITTDRSALLLGAVTAHGGRGGKQAAGAPPGLRCLALQAVPPPRLDLHLPTQQLSDLKVSAAAGGAGACAPISTNDAVAALVWTTMCQLRGRPLPGTAPPGCRNCMGLAIDLRRNGLPGVLSTRMFANATWVLHVPVVGSNDAPDGQAGSGAATERGIGSRAHSMSCHPTNDTKPATFLHALQAGASNIRASLLEFRADEPHSGRVVVENAAKMVKAPYSSQLRLACAVVGGQDAMLSSWQFPYWGADFGAGGPLRCPRCVHRRCSRRSCRAQALHDSASGLQVVCTLKEWD
ncbi:hypothetical protein FOA52_001038 [Chlamydomonas sp. UWO 241]|nr:hypothetical protein FOA52_001038 [Chlamydomonas sp. UWO 241]